MRKFIRHPSDIPIKFDIEDLAVDGTEYLNDISFGGLSFRAKSRVKAGTVIVIRIPFVEPEFETRAQVKWCRKRDGQYDVGVSFIDPEDAFRTRMVEQICHIEHYKNDVLEKEGRELTGEEAALEWIKRYAANFPKIDPSSD
ncbi:PilZ domain-containing protein [Pseudomonadota bacterium]